MGPHGWAADLQTVEQAHAMADMAKADVPADEERGADLRNVALVGHRRDGAVQAGSLRLDGLEGRLRGDGLALLEAAPCCMSGEVELFQGGLGARRVRLQYFLGGSVKHRLDAAAFN